MEAPQAETLNKLNIDARLVDRARSSGDRIAAEVQRFIAAHTTTSSERTVCRLLGIDGVDETAGGDGIPVPNRIVQELQELEVLDRGAAYWLAGGSHVYECSPQELAAGVAAGEVAVIDWVEKVQNSDPRKIYTRGEELTDSALVELTKIRRHRQKFREQLGMGPKPLKYVIVATGNIYEDIVQARAAARQGADIIAVIRSTAQSLLDYVPWGATTEGFGGTYATQKNFELMRQALDEVSQELGRYVQLVNYASGLCMPEIAALAALEGLDILLSDAMYGILFRDINPERTFVDQFFSRVVSTYAGITINTGEDNYLTTADAVEKAYTAVASQFINEAFAFRAGMPSSLMGLGHAFEKDPDLEDSFLLELGDAQLIRQLFPEAPLKFMPPTRYMTGNIFSTHVVDTLFNLAGVLTGQTIQLLGILTEATHTPHLQDRLLSLENARYVLSTARHLGEELQFKPGGIVEQRANDTLTRAVTLLEDVEQRSLWQAIAEGVFADIRRPRDGGKGRDGIIRRADDYYNPLLTKLLEANQLELGKEGETDE